MSLDRGRMRAHHKFGLSAVASLLFAMSLAISHDGETLVISALDEDGSTQGINGPDNNESGAVYLFHRNGDGWRQAAYLKAPASEIYDEYGANVALDDSGETVAVGVRLEDGGSSGVNGDQADNSVRDAGAVFVHRPPLN